MTLVTSSKNRIVSVEDTGSPKDKVYIEYPDGYDRETSPEREDIVAAYQLLFKQGTLNRLKDLSWLAQPGKKVSAIVFTIVAELSKGEIDIPDGKDKTLIVIKR